MEAGRSVFRWEISVLMFNNIDDFQFSSSGKALTGWPTWVFRRWLHAASSTYAMHINPAIIGINTNWKLNLAVPRQGVPGYGAGAAWAVAAVDIKPDSEGPVQIVQLVAIRMCNKAFAHTDGCHISATDSHSHDWCTALHPWPGLCACRHQGRQYLPRCVQLTFQTDI